MSFDLSHSFSDRLKKKRNVLLYNSAQETQYDKKQRSSYEQMRSIDQGETVFHEECPDVPWCGSTSPDLFIFKVMMNDPTTPITTILQYLPIINRENSFKLESNVTKESNYLIIRVRATILKTDSACDGISFYDVGSNTVHISYIFNTFVSGLEIIQFGNIPLSRQGYQFKGLNVQFRNTIPVILPDTSFNEIFMASPMTALNITSWNVENVVSMVNAFTNMTSLVLDLTDWNVNIEEQSWYNANGVIPPLWNTPNVDFIFKFILNSPTSNQTILNNLPVINADSSFTLTPSITTSGSYTIVNVTCTVLSNSSTQDGISFNNKASFFNDNTTALEIVQFGNIPLSRNGSQFRQLNVVISANPFILPQTSFLNAFDGCSSFNSNISLWNVSNVTNMSAMFAGCTSFNQPLNSWNVSNVTGMNQMFQSCSNFNQPLNSWNVGNVRGMAYLFVNCSSFNQPLNSWNVSNVTNMSGTFFGCSAFNQNISSWNVSSVTDMGYMFYDCISLIIDVSSWPTTAAHSNFKTGAPGVTAPAGW